MRNVLIASILFLGTVMAHADPTDAAHCTSVYSRNEPNLLTDADKERFVRQSKEPCQDLLKRFGVRGGALELFSSSDATGRADARVRGTTDGRTIKLDLRW